jgi:hypothetical protein
MLEVEALETRGLPQLRTREKTRRPNLADMWMGERGLFLRTSARSIRRLCNASRLPRSNVASLCHTGDQNGFLIKLTIIASS